MRAEHGECFVGGHERLSQRSHRHCSRLGIKQSEWKSEGVRARAHVRDMIGHYHLEAYCFLKTYAALIIKRQACIVLVRESYEPLERNLLDHYASN